MLRPRIIPCLLLRDNGLVKTVQFGDSKYIGDPLNAVRIFNEKEVDELIVLDIDATSLGREPDYELIENLAAECRMPLCYGGGIRSLEQVSRIIGSGVEKVAISAEAQIRPQFISEVASRVGSQSVVVVLDVKKRGLLGRFTIYTHNGNRRADVDLLKCVKQIEDFGAGEIVINSIDLDGVMSGYDESLIEKVRNETSLPLTVLGGAGSLDDISKLFARFGIIGAAAGSLFVFKGIYKAVLINYPNKQEKLDLFAEARKLGTLK